MPSNPFRHVCLPGGVKEVTCPGCKKHLQVIVMYNEDVPFGTGLLPNQIKATVIACSHCGSVVSVIPNQ